MDFQSDMEYTIDLRDIFRIVRKRLLIILLIPVVAVMIAGGMAFFVMPEIYQASTTLLVWKAPDQSQVALGDINSNRQLVKTYREIARSNTVMDQVISDLRLNVTAGELRSAVDVTLRGDTEIIEISVEHGDPMSAAVIANAVAQSFMDNVIRIMQVDNVVVVDEARLPNSPIKPQKQLIIAVAGMLGLMSSLFLVFLLEYLDNTIKTPADIERYLDLPLLGAIPKFRTADLTAAKGD